MLQLHYHDDDAGTESNCTKDENVFASKLKRGLSFFKGLKGQIWKELVFLQGYQLYPKNFWRDSDWKRHTLKIDSLFSELAYFLYFRLSTKLATLFEERLLCFFLNRIFQVRDKKVTGPNYMTSKENWRKETQKFLALKMHFFFL